MIMCSTSSYNLHASVCGSASDYYRTTYATYSSDTCNCTRVLYSCSDSIVSLVSRVTVRVLSCKLPNLPWYCTYSRTYRN